MKKHFIIKKLQHGVLPLNFAKILNACISQIAYIQLFLKSLWESYKKEAKKAKAKIKRNPKYYEIYKLC